MLDEESTDNFNIYLYNESVIKFRKDLVQSNISNRTQAKEWIHQLTIDSLIGSNDIGKALEEVFVSKVKIDEIHLLITGNPESGEYKDDLPKLLSMIQKDIKNRDSKGLGKLVINTICF